MKLTLALLLPALTLGQDSSHPPPKAVLEGQVLNAATGEPVRKARVTLRLSVAAGGPASQVPRSQSQQSTQARTQGTTTISAGTDNLGKFLFDQLDAGVYQLTARHEGFVEVKIGIPKDPIALAPGDRKSDFVIKMTPYAAIAGRITDEDGDPIRGIQVAMQSYRYTSRGRELADARTSITDDLGEYRVFDIPPGKYFLKVSARPNRANSDREDLESFASVYYPGASTPTSATQMEITPGQQVRHLNVILRKTHLATIRGRLIVPPGATELEVGLMVTSDTGTSTNTHNTDDNEGRFTMYNVAPGPVSVVGGYLSGGQRYWARVPLDIAGSDITGLEVRPLPPMDVTGQIRIEGQTNTKPSQIQLSLNGASGHGRANANASISDDGKILFRGLDPSLYQVTVDRLSGLYVKSVQWGTIDITEGQLDLTAGIPNRTELTVTLGADSASLEGSVKDDQGQPFESGVVTLVPNNGRSRAFRSAPTNAAGKFGIYGIAPGTYKLYAFDKVDRNAVIYDPDFLKPYESAGQGIEILPSDKRSADLKLTINKQP